MTMWNVRSPGRGGAFALLAAVLWLAPARAEGPLRGFAIEEFNERAPAFDLAGLDGGHTRSEDRRGQCLVLHLFATWCTSCRSELPPLAAARESARAQGCPILFVAVKEDGGAAEVVDYLQGIGIRDTGDFALPVALPEEYWSFGVPVTYWIDRDGVIRGRMLGPRDWRRAADAGLFAEFAAAPGSGGPVPRF